MKKITFEAELCKGCELCIDACPKKLISLDQDKLNQRGYHPADIKDVGACTGCGQCYVICPDVAIRIEK